jgi:hypothetical protein
MLCLTGGPLVDGRVDGFEPARRGQLALGDRARRRLVDEFSLLVHPVVSATGRPFAGPEAAGVRLEPLADEVVGDGLRWSRYAVVSTRVASAG